MPPLSPLLSVPGKFRRVGSAEEGDMAFISEPEPGSNSEFASESDSLSESPMMITSSAALSVRRMRVGSQGPLCSRR